jgi:hypothetical protein
VSAKAVALGAVLLLGATFASAQAPVPEERALRVEAEALYGFTLVDAPKWAQFRGLDEQNKQMMGVIGRVFLLYFGQLRAGVEIGAQQLFSYEVETIGSSGPERRRVHVDPLHFALAGRTTPNPRIDLDFGIGFYFSEESSRPGLHFGAAYRAVDGKRLTIPIGVRIATLMEENASAWPLALKVGLAWR